MIRNTAVTVCGPLNVNKLGVTYVHEHLIVKPQLPDEYYIPYTLDDEAASTEETRSFSAAGGETLVEMTPINYGRNVKAYQRIAQATGVHVICCTGFHKQLFMPPWFDDKTDGELYDILMDEVTNGLDDTEIHPGVIKLGTSFEEVTAAEKRSIEAVARVHRDTGIPISTHCDKGTMGMDQLRLLEKHGVDPKNVLLCHIDSKMPRGRYHLPGPCWPRTAGSRFLSRADGHGAGGGRLRRPRDLGRRYGQEELSACLRR